MIIQQDRDGKTPLHLLIVNVIAELDDAGDFDEEMKEVLTEIASLLVVKSIEYQVGGEYGIGGLFNTTNKEVQDQIYKFSWDRVVRCSMEHVMTLAQNQRQPILHAAIIHKAPSYIIKDILHFCTESINTVDSSNRFPIDVAVQHKLPWNDGMKNIVEVSATMQQVPAINVCAKHGVEWENGIRNILEEGEGDDTITRGNNIGHQDESTGLFPFMLAAVGGQYNYDLGSVFHLIKNSPELEVIQQYGNHSVEATSRKRKRCEAV